MKKPIIFLLCLFGSLWASSQAGAHFYAGTSNAYNEMEVFTPTGTSHPGFHVGLDGRLNEGNMYFILGAQYHNISHEAADTFRLRNHPHNLHWVKLRGGLGFNVLRFTKFFKVRAKALASLDLLYPQLEVAEFHLNSQGPYTYNSGTASGVLGFGVEIFGITADIEYHKNFLNAINDIGESKVNFWLLNVGLFF